MVTNVTSITNLGRSGLFDWVTQRLSAIILAAYTVFILYWLSQHSPSDYEQWRALFDGTAMRIFSLLALLALIVHAWIGIWTIATDYLTSLTFGKAATAVRLTFLCACALLVFVYLVWGIQILWG